jgi:hypothetical protein
VSTPKKSKQTAKKTSKVKAPAKKTAAKTKGATAKKSKLLVKPGKAAKKTAPKSGGTKRSAEELTKLKSNIVLEVTANTGITTEQIAKNLGTTTKALAMPLRQLRATKTLSTSGTRRFLRYFPKGQAPKESARKKAA